MTLRVVSHDLTDEEARALFEAMRQKALISLHYFIPLHEIPKADRSALTREWLAAGLIVKYGGEGTTSQMCKWQLAPEYRAWGPGEVREISPDDLEMYLNAARLSRRENNTIRVQEFQKLAPREGLLRLVEKGYVSFKRPGETTSHVYTLLGD
jgi:hypothetical protein